jgi:hypothetical protein
MWKQWMGVAIVVTGLAAPAGSAVQKSKSGPVMEIEPTDHDFGGVRQNQKLVHEFTVNNTGTEDLEIIRIATSCGCTAAVSAERIIKPGASTTLEVTLETRKYKGVIQKSISVASNDRQVVRTIRIHAFVEE